jgi:hypothetical protein
MIETKIKCDNHGYMYSYDKKKYGVLLSEAIAENWYEIEIVNGNIKICQPARPGLFVVTAKHACSPAHARAVIEALALELIPDKVEEVKSNG